MKETALIRHQKLEDILFPVVKLEAGELFSDTSFANNLSHSIYLPDQKKVVQMCSETYQLVDNEYLLGSLYDRMKEIFGAEGFETEVDSYDDRKFYVKFIIREQVLELTKGDEINPVIEITNSYDGSVKQRVALGYHRLICANGMMAFTESFSADQKHSTRVGKISMEPIFKELDKIEIRLDRFKRLTDRKVTTEEMHGVVKKIRASATIKYPMKLVPTAPLIAQKEAAQLDMPLSAWLLYNGFNNALYHSEGKLLPEERERIDRRVLKVIEKELSLN